jgi:hypothetical protein
MEKVYPRVAQTDKAEVYLRAVAAGGRVIYFPWDIDRTFWEVLCVTTLSYCATRGVGHK